MLRARGNLRPVIVFPVYKTVFRQQLHCTVVRQALRPVNLYRGMLPPLLIKTLNGALLFGLQDTLLHQLSSAPSFNPLSALPAFAGMGTGVVEALFCTPFERVQNILQNSQNDLGLPTLRSVLQSLSNHSHP